MILCDRWVRKIASTFDIYLGTPRRGGKPSIYLYSILHRPGSSGFGLASVVGDSGHIATVPGRDPGPCISVIGPKGRRFRPKWPSPFAYSTAVHAGLDYEGNIRSDLCSNSRQTEHVYTVSSQRSALSESWLSIIAFEIPRTNLDIYPIPTVLSNAQC